VSRRAELVQARTVEAGAEGPDGAVVVMVNLEALEDRLAVRATIRAAPKGPGAMGRHRVEETDSS